MRDRPIILFHGPADLPAPDVVRQWAERRGFPLALVSDPAMVEAVLLRGHPALVFLDAACRESGRALVGRIKVDPFTAIIPVMVLAGDWDGGRDQGVGGGEAGGADAAEWFAAGADEVLSPGLGPEEQQARLDALVARAVRDVAVHPSTRMPGTTEIERAIRNRIDGTVPFAVCYADLDHFKEFNDRYGYYEGDRVIYIVSRILHDVVRGMVGADGFVGHIGGDDFIFIVPEEWVEPVCTEILHVFDALGPLQYNEQDRRAGYFFGKDRRGQLHRVPLMTLSIGIVTSRNRAFSHPAEVSELATEMKSYAKTLPGSVFVVDRRQARDTGGPSR